MKVYLIEKSTGKRAYLSFSRLLKEEKIEEYCKSYKENMPTKTSLPASLLSNKIIITCLEVDERI
jgi:hypothetical protein